MEVPQERWFSHFVPNALPMNILTDVMAYSAISSEMVDGRPQMIDPTDLLIYTFYPVELESQVDLYVTVYSLSIRREARLHRLL